jgi:hypothetical protein
MTTNPHTDFPAWCRERRACDDGQEFADDHRTLKSFWSACQRPDWMLWVYSRLELSKNNDRALRLFAVWCARSVQQTDPRSIAAIDCAERFANGIAAMAELSAARSAAESAAESAARSAAWSSAESAARSAAESAARSAAWSAAWSAARSAAWSAAWSAARSAAWSSAESAALSAAWSAAESAAESAQANAMRRFITDQDLA